MELLSDKYRLVQTDDGRLSVYNLTPPRLRVTRIDATGITTFYPDDDSTRELNRHLASAPYFTAVCRKPGEWWVDLDCGAQRWCGVKTSREVSRAIRLCGFDPKPIMAKARRRF